MGEGGVGTPGMGRRVCGGVYRRRQPEGSLLYRAVRENLATLRLERLCRYGARGALAMERFKEAQDGRIATG